MNRKYERLNFGEEGRARLRHEQEVPIEIRQVIRRIEERSASLLSFACRYREKITDHQRDLVAQVISCSIDELKQMGEWFCRCQESYLIDRKAGEKFRSVTKITE